MPPELVKLLRPHQAVRHDCGRADLPDHPGAAYSRTRPTAWCEPGPATRPSPLPSAGRRPAAALTTCGTRRSVSLWLNSGVPATEVARRAGHGVAVLLKVYAHCIDGQAHAVNKRITDALGVPRHPA